MNKPEVEVSPGAAVLLALIFFYEDGFSLEALLLAAAVHELGHTGALLLLGGKIRKISLGLLGFTLDYAGNLEGRKLLCILLAGPGCGLLLSLFFWNSSVPLLCGTAEISLALSLFNLLPVLPLDGGRAMSLLPEKRQIPWLWPVSFLFLMGLASAFTGRGMSLLLLSLWLGGYHAVF